MSSGVNTCSSSYHMLTPIEIREAAAFEIAQRANSAATLASRYSRFALVNGVALSALSHLGLLGFGGICGYGICAGAYGLSKRLFESRAAKPVVWAADKAMSNVAAGAVAAACAGRMYMQSPNKQYMPSVFDVARAFRMPKVI